MKQDTRIFRLSRRIENPSTQGRHYPVTATIPPEDVVYDPKTKQARTIRYCYGERTIWKDEQSEAAKRSNIVFTNGVLRTEKEDSSLRAYLDACNYNGSNENRDKRKSKLFYEEVKSENASKDNEVHYLRADLISTIRDLDHRKVIGLAKAMNVATNQSVAEIRHDLIIQSQKNPVSFQEVLDNPVTERKQVIIEAKETGLISFNTASRQIKWNKPGVANGIICTYPIGTSDPVGYLANLTFQPDGQDVYDSILKFLNIAQTKGATEAIEEVQKEEKPRAARRKKPANTAAATEK